jgi:hypothetical protein
MNRLRIMDPGRKDRGGKDSVNTGSVLFAAAACLIALAVYAGTLTHELVWDDTGVLEHIGSITEKGGLKAVFTSQFATHVEEGYVSGFYRPVPMISLWLDTMYATLFPFQYHLVNILLHGINTILVFLLINTIATPFAAFAGSVIFAVHPVHSESVSFVSGRTDLWAAIFLLLSVYLWLRVRKRQAKSAVVEGSVSVGAFLLACLSKEVAYVMPAVLLLWDAVLPAAIPGQRQGWWVRNRSWIFGWLAVLSCVAVMRYVVFGPSLGLDRSGGLQAQSAGGFAQWALVARIFLMYLRLVILPWPLKVFYSPHELVLTMTTVTAVLVLVSLLIITYRRGLKAISVSAAVWITVFLLPVLATGLRDGAPLAERFLYLPSVGFCLLAGVLADTCTKRRPIVLSGLGLLVILMSLATCVQNRVWKDEIALFTELTAVSPLSPDGHYNLGNALSEKGRHTESVNAFRRAIDIDPRHFRAYFNMGNSLRSLGQLSGASDAFRETLRLENTFVPAYVNLGVTYMEMRDYDLSVDIFLRGLSYAPGDLRLHTGLMLAFLGKGDRTAAEAHHSALKKTNPEIAVLIGRIITEYKK